MNNIIIQTIISKNIEINEIYKKNNSILKADVQNQDDPKGHHSNNIALTSSTFDDWPSPFNDFAQEFDKTWNDFAQTDW